MHQYLWCHKPYVVLRRAMLSTSGGLWEIPQTCNIKRNLIGNKIVDHSNLVGAYISNLALAPDFNGLDNDNCKTRRETFKFWNFCALYQRFYGNVSCQSARILEYTVYKPEQIQRLEWKAGESRKGNNMMHVYGPINLNMACYHGSN